MAWDGIVQLVASVILLSSAWPLTKIALARGATPLWFAEGRAVLSGVTVFAIVVVRGRLRWPGRADLAAIAAIGGLQLAGYFAFSISRSPGFRPGVPPSSPTPRRSGSCRCR